MYAFNELTTEELEECAKCFNKLLKANATTAVASFGKKRTAIASMKNWICEVWRSTALWLK